MKKIYQKPTMLAYNLRTTEIICTSNEPYYYPRPFGYAPEQKDDEKLMA
jgi:hypothetical protein